MVEVIQCSVGGMYILLNFHVLIVSWIKLDLAVNCINLVVNYSIIILIGASFCRTFFCDSMQNREGS